MKWIGEMHFRVTSVEFLFLHLQDRDNRPFSYEEHRPGVQIQDVAKPEVALLEQSSWGDCYLDTEFLIIIIHTAHFL